MSTDNILKSRRGQGGDRRKTWADTQSIKSGVMGDVHKGITICEKNRATVYERYKAGIIELQWYLQRNYRDKGIDAVLYGIDDGKSIRYAVFVQDNWLRDVGDNTRCPHCVQCARERRR